jgi:NADPH:quinone reductase-like Zn-dependent oxidoreductase
MQATLNALMKAVRVHSYGASDVLTFEDAPRPVPAAGEVLVRVVAAGVNPIDWKIRSGLLKEYRPLPIPFIPGHDVSGIVEAVGSNVTAFSEGDAVYGVVNGGYAQFAIGKESELALKPRTIDHLHSAAIPLAALAAWQALFDTANLSSGQRVLIHGAAGGVGSLAVQLAKWKGAYVGGTASGRNQSFLRVLGVDVPINYEKTKFEHVMSGIDAVIDTVGGEMQARSWKVIRRGGILVSTAASPSAEDAIKYPVRSAMVLARPNTAQLTKIADLFDRGSIRPIVETILPLSDAKSAHDLSETGHVRGKIVLTVASA